MTNKLKLFPEFSGLSNPRIRAIAVLAIGVAIFSFAPILVKLGENEISPTAIVFHRFWLAAIIIGLRNGLLSVKSRISTDRVQSPQVYTNRTLGFLLGSGICFAATHLIWAWSLTQTSVANSSLLHNLTPLFVILGGWLLFARNFNRRFMIGTMVAVMGSIILGFDDFLYETDHIQGDIIALISAFVFSIYFLLLEQIRNQFELATLVFYYCAIGTVTVMPFLSIGQGAILPSSLNGWLIVMGLSFIHLLFYVISTYAIKWLSSGLVSVILLTESVFGALLAWNTFSEVLDFWNLLAFLVILLGVYLAITSKSTLKDEVKI